VSNFSHETSEISTHAGHIDALAQEIGTISTTLHSGGVGSTEMYGILVGQLAHPVLSAVAGSKSQAITSLSEVLGSTVQTLHTAAQTYSSTEIEAADKSKVVQSQIKQIQIPS